MNDKLGETDPVEGEIAAEQAFVDRVYLQLEESARNAQQLAREGQARGELGHEGGLVERDAMVYQAARRIAQLDAAHEGLVFGRLDLQRSVDRHPRYIGRIGLRDEHRDSLLIDWRAPAAAVFYQATAADPRKVIRRRVDLAAHVEPAEDQPLVRGVERRQPAGRLEDHRVALHEPALVAQAAAVVALLGQLLGSPRRLLQLQVDPVHELLLASNLLLDQLVSQMSRPLGPSRAS